MNQQELKDFQSQSDALQVTNVYMAAQFFIDALTPILQNKKQRLFEGKTKETLNRLLVQSVNMNRDLFRNLQKNNLEIMYHRNDTIFFKLIKLLSCAGPSEQAVFLKVIERVLCAPEKRQWVIHLQDLYGEINSEYAEEVKTWAERESRLKELTSAS